MRETSPVAPSTEDALPQLWARVLQEVGRFLATSLEKAAIPAISGPNTLVLRFPAAYNQAQEICATPGNVARIEEKLRLVTGKGWSLRMETIGELPARTAAVTPTRPRRNDKEEAEKGPLVRRVKEVLGGQILFAEEGFGLESTSMTPAAGAAEPDEPAEET